MERRRFLHLGAAAGAAVAGGSGCGQLLGTPASATADLPDMDAFFAKLDGAMEAVAKGDPLAALVAPRCSVKHGQSSKDRDPGESKQPFSDRDKLLIQKSLRSLLLAGAVHELPEAARHHPGMMARLNAGMGEMDEAVFGMTELLEGLSPGDRVELGRRIQKDPGLPMRVAESLDADASALKVPHQRRLRLRRLASHVSWRLKNQPPESLLDEYTTKVRRLAARNGYDEELQRQLAARAGTAVLFAPGALAGQPTDPDPAPPAPDPAPPGPDPAPAATDAAPPPAPTTGWASAPAEPAGPPPSPAPASPPPAPTDWHGSSPATDEAAEPCDPDRGSTPMTVGGILMGVAAALGIVGGVVVASGSIAGAFLLTGGGLLLLAGLITLIVGAAMAAGAPDC